MHEEGFSFLTSGYLPVGGRPGRSALPDKRRARNARRGVSGSFTPVVNNPGRTRAKNIFVHSTARRRPSGSHGTASPMNPLEWLVNVILQFCLRRNIFYYQIVTIVVGNASGGLAQRNQGLLTNGGQSSFESVRTPYCAPARVGHGSDVHDRGHEATGEAGSLTCGYF